ncbi:hypothetical protein ACET9K_04980 [Aeromonas enteropelogenes]|uniref:hypothetical protein n=1 Tax=Aeromonas enteropelogenes TaxID=29489 RepID=UPI0038D18D0F
MSMNRSKGHLSYDFEHDVYLSAKRYITKLGYIPLKHCDTTQLLSQMFNILRNYITPKPRKVHIAKGLKFPREYLTGINHVIDEITNGVNLMPRCSRKQLNQRGHIDGMLLDWGIHHLHIGTKKVNNGKNKGLIEGGKYILFCCFHDDDAYLIGLYDHKSWTKANVIEVIANNWDFILEPYYLRGVVGLSREVNDSDRLLLRNSQINTPIKVGNKFYFGPGGGMTCSGYGANEVGNALEIMRAMDNLSDWVSDNTEYLEGKIRNHVNKEIEIELHFDMLKYMTSKTIVLYDKNHGLSIYIPSSDEPASFLDREKSLLLVSNERDLEYIHPLALKGNVYIETV